MKNLTIGIYYKGNDPNDCRHYGTYENVKKIEYDENGNVFIKTKDNDVSISSMFADFVTVIISKK